MNDLGTNWSSRHPEREALEREILDFDVLYIGGGPANLISLWHLLNQIEEAKKDIASSHHWLDRKRGSNRRSYFQRRSPRPTSARGGYAGLS